MLLRTIFPRTIRTLHTSETIVSSIGFTSRSRRSFHTMASSTPVTHRFTQSVVKAMRSLYPEELADRSWDNVGLLLDNIEPDQEEQRPPVVLVTNDLTISVADEAIRKKATVIVSYHPFLFRPIKSISLTDPHQRIILQLVQNNIAVYSPHTAVDAAPGGMGDWLAEMLPLPSSAYTKSVVHPLPVSATIPEGAGYGRRVDLHQEVELGLIIDAFAKGLGGQRYLTVARPRGVSSVQSFAVCPGSGYDVLKDCDVDLLVTGEMTHHNALKAVMQGRCVITAFHSNSERTFLRDRLRPQLEEVLGGEVPGVRVLVSEVDEDPFEIVDVENLVMRGGGP